MTAWFVTCGEEMERWARAEPLAIFRLVAGAIFGRARRDRQAGAPDIDLGRGHDLKRDRAVGGDDLVRMGGAQPRWFDPAFGFDPEAPIDDPPHDAHHRFMPRQIDGQPLAEIQDMRRLASDAGFRNIAKGCVESSVPRAAECRLHQPRLPRLALLGGV